VNFCAIGFYNEADTLESISILIYSNKEQCIYTQKWMTEAILIEKVN